MQAKVSSELDLEIKYPDHHLYIVSKINTGIAPPMLLM